jgi:hypothetical protein
LFNEAPLSGNPSSATGGNVSGSNDAVGSGGSFNSNDVSLHQSLSSGNTANLASDSFNQTESTTNSIASVVVQVGTAAASFIG